MTNLNLIVLLATQPRRAFEELDARPRILFPLLLGLLTTVGLLLWYYAVVDIDWLIDQSLTSSPRAAAMTEAQRAQAAAFLSRRVLMWSSVGGGIVLVLLMRTLEAAYFMLVGKVTNVQRSFKHWFALAWWTSLPLLLTLVPTVLLMLLRHSDQFAADVLQPLSLNALFFNRGMGASGYTLLTTLTLLHPLAWLLSVIGLKTWSGRSWPYSALVVLLPIVICYGCWAFFTLGSR
jgi:hypothetical protein